MPSLAEGAIAAWAANRKEDPPPDNAIRAWDLQLLSGTSSVISSNPTTADILALLGNLGKFKNRILAP